MTTTDPHEPIRRRDDLLVPFTEACKPRSEWRIGPEMEKFGLIEATRRPMPYLGERSVLRVLEHLAQNHGWVPEREHDGGPIIALMRGGASITLEPGAQLELSGDKAENIHQVCAELRAHLREIAPVSKAMGVRWLGVGFHPFARREDFEWVPKQRYGVMREYLPTRGGHALDMMLRTCTVQVNLDYASEADAMRKMRVALALAPATTAMFANSPWKEGRPHGGVDLPRSRLARRRPRSHGALSARCGSGAAASTTTWSGRSTSRCSSSSGAGTRSRTRGSRSAPSSRAGSRATRRRWKTGRPTSTRSFPRCA